MEYLQDQAWRMMLFTHVVRPAATAGARGSAQEEGLHRNSGASDQGALLPVLP